MPPVIEREWLGRRIVTRRVIGREGDREHVPDGEARETHGKLLFGDVVGDLVRLDDREAYLDTDDGIVEVIRELVVAAKLAPPAAAAELALEEIASRGWQAADTGQLGGWLLRANHGVTGRANSVLPLRSAGLPLEEALSQARQWYADRGLPLMFANPTEARRLLDAELGERGWEPSEDVHVMVSRLDFLEMALETAGAMNMPAQVELSAQADTNWMSRYRDGTAGPHALALLNRHERAAFASITGDGERDDEIVAIARGVVDDGWLGVSAVEVAPNMRRQGLARAALAALTQWGQTQGAKRCYLQVTSSNTAALTLYRDLGFWVHHDYRYRTESVPTVN